MGQMQRRQNTLCRDKIQEDSISLSEIDIKNLNLHLRIGPSILLKFDLL